MKNLTCKLTLVVLMMICFSANWAQDSPNDKLIFAIQDISPLMVSQDSLQDALTISDINHRFPSDWVLEYIDVTVTAICDGIQITKKGKGHRLNDEQRALISCADVDSDLRVNVLYMPKNNLKKNESKNLNFSMIVKPYVQATFEGGRDEMNTYIQSNIADKVGDFMDISKLYRTSVKFTVNSDGQVSHVINSHSSENMETDSLLHRMICEMPRWIPAKNLEGEHVAQTFELVLGNNQSCLIPELRVD